MDCACGRDSHRGREGQKEGHKGNMKVVRTDRFPSPSHFLESSKTLATLSDLCDLCVSLSFARGTAQDRPDIYGSWTNSVLWHCEELATACGILPYGWAAAFQIPFESLGDCHPRRNCE